MITNDVDFIYEALNRCNVPVTIEILNLKLKIYLHLFLSSNSLESEFKDILSRINLQDFISYLNENDELFDSLDFTNSILISGMIIENKNNPLTESFARLLLNHSNRFISICN